MDKYGRNYRLDIQKKDGTTLTVQPPFTIEFDIHRNSFQSANAGQVRVYNLAPETRTLIRKNFYDFFDFRSFSFSAGYGDMLSLAYKGIMSQAWSVREGTNMITQIESFDSGFAYINAISDVSFPAGTDQKSIITKVSEGLAKSGVELGSIGNYTGQISRGNSYSGSTPNILDELSGGGCFFDNGKVHCLQEGECLDGPVMLINAQSGLLGTPVIENQFINLETLFEPGIQVGQIVQLESDTDSFFNGSHKVISLVHQGMISSAVCGSAVTRIGLLPGNFTPVGRSVRI